MARIIAPVLATPHPAKTAVRCALIAWLVLTASASRLDAHDLEKTQVRLTFARDGSFVLDVSNDPAWLKLRLASVPGNFADRVVLWVDGREIRPASVEYVPGATLDSYRMRGTLPRDAKSLRWYYGLVIDPYPLTVARADGRILVEEVQGDAWSRSIDVSGQFGPAYVNTTAAAFVIAALLALPIALRLRASPKDAPARSTAS
ncbi:MAG TPA: hypothetical protein VH583_02595 [Vicinamibacterales bacterium]